MASQTGTRHVTPVFNEEAVTPTLLQRLDALIARPRGYQRPLGVSRT